MARFRLLVIVSTVWLTFIFNLERPDFDFIGLGNIDIDSVVYVIAAIAALASLWLPDISRRTEYIFIPTLFVYTISKIVLGTPVAQSTIPIIVLEIVVLFVTISLFRRISVALLNFEQTVDNVLLRPDSLHVMEMAEGMERVQEEISRARRFERQVGIILLSARPNQEQKKLLPYRFDLEEQLQKHYLQLRVAQVAELVLYKVDMVMLHQNDVLVCLPETTLDIVHRKAKELVEEIHWRLDIDVIAGVAIFPDDGFIYRDLVDKATVRMYEAQAKIDAAAKENEHDSDSDGDSGITSDTASASINNNRIVNSVSERRISPFTQVFNPWPDVILRYQRMEKYGSRDNDERDALFNPLSWLGAMPYQSETSRTLYILLKRMLDLFLVGLALPFAAPAMGLVALAIWLEDHGPIFFIQQRTGFGGERFSMYKFRTMVPDAEEKLKELAAQGLAKLDANGKLAEPLKLKRDPRITRVGRILRKTSLDEIPQLLNVLKGDMSLVGPRPTSWSTTTYRLFHTERLQVRPGITGLWQVAARGSTNFNEWVDWDRMYIDKMCLSLDIQILVRTFTKVFQQRGAR